MRLRGLWCLSLLLLIGSSMHSCKAQRTELSDLQGENIDPHKRELGSGYDTFLHKRVERCVDISEINYIGSDSSEYKFLSDATSNDLIDEIDMGLHGGVNLFGLVSLKASGNVITTLATTDQSGAYVYKFEIEGKNATIPQVRLNSVGMDAYRRNDPAYFRKVCGDHFVHQIKLAAKLFVGVKFVFNSKENKEKLMAQLKGSALWGLIKFSKTWSKESKELLRNVRVQVEAYQIGGDQSALEDAKNSIHQGSCAGDDAEKCAASLDRMLDYGKNDFPKQLNNMKWTSGDGGPAVMRVMLKRYTDRDVYRDNGKDLALVKVGETSRSGKVASDALGRLSQAEIDLTIESIRLASLKDFRLSDQEIARIVHAQGEINAVKDAVIAIKQRCIEALTTDALSERCSADAGRILTQADKALKPIEIGSRG